MGRTEIRHLTNGSGGLTSAVVEYGDPVAFEFPEHPDDNSVNEPITGSDWMNNTPGGPFPPTPLTPEVYEAEEGELAGTASIGTNHEGYNGQGFVDYITQDGDGVTITVASAEARQATARIRYASDAPGPSQTLNVIVNDGIPTQVAFPVTGDWSTWDSVEITVDLASGQNLIDLVMEPGNTGAINIDLITISRP